MANYVKYSTNAQTRALKMGNFWLGPVNDGKGPTSSTGYYTSLNPPSGGFTIYANKASDGPAIFQASNESQLVSITNQLGGTSFTTSGQCLTWYVTQTDKFCVNRDYEGIVTNGLVLNLDAGFTPSYPTSGTSWYDLGPSGNTGTLTNGPTFNSSNGGSIVFDGTDDYTQTNSNSGISGSNPYTFEIFLNVNSSEIGSGRRGWFMWQGLGSQSTNQLIGLCVNNGSIEIAHWNNDTVYTNSIINFGNWQHIVTTYSSGTERIYINGVNTNTKSIGTLSIVNGKITLAGIAGDSSSVNTLNCQIGLHRIYNRELTAVEVLQNYNAMKGRFGL